MTKQDCSDRYQFAAAVLARQSNCTHGQEMAWRAGSVRNIGLDPVNHPIRPLDERFPRQPVIRIVDPQAVVLRQGKLHLRRWSRVIRSPQTGNPGKLVCRHLSVAQG